MGLKLRTKTMTTGLNPPERDIRHKTSSQEEIYPVPLQTSTPKKSTSKVSAVLSFKLDSPAPGAALSLQTSEGAVMATSNNKAAPNASCVETCNNSIFDAASLNVTVLSVASFSLSNSPKVSYYTYLSIYIHLYGCTHVLNENQLHKTTFYM